MSLLPVQAQTFTLAGAGSLIGDVTLTLTSFQSIDGINLTMANFGTIGYATIEPNSGNNEEQISFTGVTNNTNGTATLTGVSTVLFLSPYTETSGLAKTHSGGVQFVISNTSAFYSTFLNKTDNSIITGVFTFATGASPLITDDPTTNLQAANKHYVDNVAIAGAPNASDVTIGITKLSVAALSPTNPIAVGNNDTRVPTVDVSSVTAGEIAALPGTSGTPGSGNKYVTNADTATAATIGAIARRNSTGDVTVNTSPTASTDATSKSYVDSKASSYKTGNTTYNLATASGNQTIAHGLGITPKFIRITAGTVSGNVGGTNPWDTLSIGSYDGTTNNCLYQINISAIAHMNYSLDTSNTIHLESGSGLTQLGTITVDATNITIAWTRAGSTPNGTANIVWEAMT